MSSPCNGEVNEFVDANWNQACVRGSGPDWRQGHSDSAAVAGAAFLVSHSDWALSWTEGTDRVVLLVGGSAQHELCYRNICGGPSLPCLLDLIFQCSCLNLRPVLCITQLLLPPNPLTLEDKCFLSLPPGNISWLVWSVSVEHQFPGILSSNTYGIIWCMTKPSFSIRAWSNMHMCRMWACSSAVSWPQPHYTLTLIFPYTNTS